MQQKPLHAPLYSRKQAAAYLGVSVTVFDQLIARLESLSMAPKPIPFGDRSDRWELADLDALVRVIKWIGPEKAKK
jgi:predicted DNA-binding transcriptional regulator AlpA